jgi:transposase
MAYRTIHTKKNGAKYVYSVTSYWDKEKKASRNKQVCLGRLDESTGEVVPSKRKKSALESQESIIGAKVTVTGPMAVLGSVVEGTGLGRLLERSFPEHYRQVLSLACFLVQKGLPLYRCETWSTSHIHPFGGVMASQRVSELLMRLSEGGMQRFFSLWMDHLSEKECFLYDITSVSSYSEQNEYVRFGYNRDGERLPQINLAMLYGKDSGLPAWYRRLPGNISDVSTLQTTIKSLDFIGRKEPTVVLDRGFYSEANIDALFGAKCRFVLACPKRKWVEALYEGSREGIVAPQNRQVLSENEVLYMLTKPHDWKGRKCYAHIYFNNVRAAEEQDALALKLAQWKEELETGNEKSTNAWAYEKYFVVKETPKRGRKVTENTQAVQDAMKKHAGFVCLLTSQKMDALTALEIYRKKQSVEDCFDDLKNTLDMKRLRIHSSQAMDARLFIQFIALIILSRVRSIKNQDRTLRNLSVREIMEAMETISEIRFSGRYGKATTETGPIQRRILEAFHSST